MKDLPTIVFLIAGFALGFLFAKSRYKSDDARIIDADHRAMIVTITTRLRKDIAYIRGDNDAADKKIDSLTKLIHTRGAALSMYKAQEASLQNALNALRHDKDYTYPYSDSVDIAAKRLIYRLPK